MTGLRVSRRLRAEHRCEEVILSKQELPAGVCCFIVRVVWDQGQKFRGQGSSGA